MVAMTRFGFLWSSDLAAKVEMYAASNGISVSDVIRWALTEKVSDVIVPLESASNQELIDEIRRRNSAAPS